MRDSDGERYPLLQVSDVADFLHSCLSLALALPVSKGDEHKLWGRDELLFAYQDTTVLIAFVYAHKRSESSVLLPQAIKQIRAKKYGKTFKRRPFLWRLAMVFCAESREITDVQVVSE